MGVLHDFSFSIFFTLIRFHHECLLFLLAQHGHLLFMYRNEWEKSTHAHIVAKSQRDKRDRGKEKIEQKSRKIPRMCAVTFQLIGGLHWTHGKYSIYASTCNRACREKKLKNQQVAAAAAASVGFLNLLLVLEVFSHFFPCET